MAFDIGIHHFAWAKMRRGREETDSEVLAMDCHDFGPSQKLVELYPLLLQYLRSLDYTDVHTVLIEQQMNRMNIRATKISVFVYAYFLMEHSPSIHVLEYPAYHKTKAFGMHGLSKSERKKWSVQHVLTHVVDSDPVALDWLQQFPKKDDICDCIMMIQSFSILPPKIKNIMA